jgi:hypothetical protein
MSGNTTRRGFLWQSAAASGALAISGLPGAAAVRSQEPTPENPLLTPNASEEPSREIDACPLIVVTQPASRDIDPRSGTWVYITEVLRRAGLFFRELPVEQVQTWTPKSNAIIVLAGQVQLNDAQRDCLAELVKQGHALIGIGGTSGLDQVFGVKGTIPVAEGWMKVSAADHPITAGLRSSLHVFGGHAARAATARPLAELVSGVQPAARGSAILENRFGEGQAILLAPDLLFSIVHIQQGIPVLQDGKPAPDDSARLDDGILKAEDGLVLDWQRDRSPMEPDGTPVFLEPITDELREIILRAIFFAAQQRGIALPMFWYWPRGLKAVGHISHDSDGNNPELAAALLQVMIRNRVKSTWCIIHPGYSREFYRELKEHEFEIALHYDAHTGGELTSWSRENFVFQHRWLMDEAGLEHIVSNKNHYTRWESRLDFFRWCEEFGIRSDQSRGPSKKGTIGFPLGGSQPFFPLDDLADPPRYLDVLEVNMLTQDLVIVCPAEYGRQLLDSALRHYGVAHFLFHPAHILKPGVADALGDLLEYGRSQGIEWWTSQQIYRWEKQRRGVEASFGSPTTITLRTAKPLEQATLLLLKPQVEGRSLSLDGQPVASDPWNLYGFEFQAVQTDLAGEVTLRIGCA